MQGAIHTGTPSYLEARSEFQKAHARARLLDVFDRLLRRCRRLYALTDVAVKSVSGGCPRVAAGPTQTRLIPGPRRLVEDVLLERVVGSLGRADDYTADFLPRRGSDEERWARVRVALDSLEGVPPIELYQVGADYYVKDGHHRVSVMKRMGLRHVEAYVTRLVPVG